MDNESRNFFRKEFDIDIVKEFNDLKDFGTISADKLKSKNTLIKMINKAADCEFRAKRIFFKAKKEYNLFMVEYNSDMRALERKAVVRLKAWLDNTGTGSRKQITKEDVIKMICSKEDSKEIYKKVLLEHEEMKEILDNCESLANRWKTRSITLQAQAKLVQSTTNVVLGGKKR